MTWKSQKINWMADLFAEGELYGTDYCGEDETPEEFIKSLEEIYDKVIPFRLEELSSEDGTLQVGIRDGEKIEYIGFKRSDKCAERYFLQNGQPIAYQTVGISSPGWPQEITKISGEELQMFNKLREQRPNINSELYIILRKHFRD